MYQLLVLVGFFALACLIAFFLAKDDFPKNTRKSLSSFTFIIFLFGTILLCYQDNRTHFWNVDLGVPYEVVGCDEKKEKCVLRNPLGEMKFYRSKNSTESAVGMTFIKKAKGEYEQKRTLPPSKG